MLEVRQFPCLSDNYGFLVHDPATGDTATVDTPDADAILAEAARAGWRISKILNTHWHQDHAGGNDAIKAATGAIVYAPAEIAKLGAQPDHLVADGDTVSVGAHRARVISVGGHTLGHVAYEFADDRIAFVGDTVFSLGCGRMFEGTPDLFWSSLQKIRALPQDTTLYCAHEYTASNARFALSVDPENAALQARAAEVDRLRAENRPTVPMRLSAELETNPFLRAPQLKGAVGLPASAPDHEAFAELRRRKDVFK